MFFRDGYNRPHHGQKPMTIHGRLGHEPPPPIDGPYNAPSRLPVDFGKKDRDWFLGKPEKLSNGQLAIGIITTIGTLCLLWMGVATIFRF